MIWRGPKWPSTTEQKTPNAPISRKVMQRADRKGRIPERALVMTPMATEIDEAGEIGDGPDRVALARPDSWRCKPTNNSTPHMIDDNGWRYLIDPRLADAPDHFVDVGQRSAGLFAVDHDGAPLCSTEPRGRRRRFRRRPMLPDHDIANRHCRDRQYQCRQPDLPTRRQPAPAVPRFRWRPQTSATHRTRQ